MPEIQEITGSLISDHTCRAVRKVFTTMLNREPKLVGGGERAPGQPAPAGLAAPSGLQVVGSVGFIGKINGLMYVYFSEEFARLATRHLLGLGEKDRGDVGPEVIHDATGELTNMTVGGFKNGLCDAGYPCKLTIPSILRGHDLMIEPVSSSRRYEFVFDCVGHRVTILILVKAGD